MTVTGTPGQYPARYCGRDFTLAELEEIRSLAATLPTRRAIADAICDALGWQTPGGRRKDMTARVALGRMAADGLITLPPPRNGNGNGRHPRHGHPGQLALPLPAHPAATLADLGPVTISVVDSRQASRQWNQLIRDHHYLGYTPLAGAADPLPRRRPRRLPDRRLRLRRQRLEMRPPRRLDRLGPRHPPRQPEPDLRQRPVPHPPRPGGPQPRLLAARRRHPPAARRLAGPLRLRPGPGRDLRRGRPVHRRQLPRRQLDPHWPDQGQGQARPPP